MTSLCKALTLLFLTAVMASAADIPTVSVYQIRKHGYDPSMHGRGIAEVILELSNPTSSTFYITGDSIERPHYEVEAQREGRWLRIPHFVSGNGTSIYPLRPGTKVLMTILPPSDETVTRYRFHLRTSDQPAEAKLISVWSPPIERKDLGK